MLWQGSRVVGGGHSSFNVPSKGVLWLWAPPPALFKSAAARFARDNTSTAAEEAAKKTRRRKKKTKKQPRPFYRCACKHVSTRPLPSQCV